MQDVNYLVAVERQFLSGLLRFYGQSQPSDSLPHLLGLKLLFRKRVGGKYFSILTSLSPITLRFLVRGPSAESLMEFSFINSFVITIPAVVFPIALATMAAYCLAWVKFKGSDAIFYGIFALQIVPIQVTLVPLLLLFGNRISSGIHIGSVQVFPGLHIAGKFLGIWVPHTMFALPLAIYLLHNFIASLPRDLMEAANVDGASHFMVFRKIVLPLSIPAIAAFSIFQFLWVWNDLLVALTFTGGTEGINPLNAKLAGLAGTWGSHWELLTSSAFITILVPLVVFFSLQRYFVRGLLAGSVK
jgi:alpha-glucoside transport system permease protein